MPPSSRAPWIAPELDKVVLRALAPDREQRFQSAEEFRLALSDVITQVAPRTDPARVVELMQAVFQDVIDTERAEREHLLKDVIPAFRASSSAPPKPAAPRARAPQPAAADKPRSVFQSKSPPATPMQARPKPPSPAKGEQHDGSVRLPGVTPSPVAVDPRLARREAALRVLAELAAEDAEPTPAPVQARK
jgi:serine/threonine-protein kinase